MSVNIKNPKYNAFGTIDVEYQHPVYGWIPFTANPSDTEVVSKEIYDIALAMGPEAYVAPPVPKPTESQIRAERDSLLSASDWTQLPDAPVDRAAWAVYRQALRDITSQEGFPTDVVWPIKPE